MSAKQHQKITIDTSAQQALFWLIAFLIIAAGFYLTSIEFMNKEWLSRSGCLVVILGIWSGLGEIIQERILLGRLGIQRRFAIVRAKRRFRKINMDAKQIKEELDDIEDEFQDKFDLLREKLRLTVGLLEVSLLITGTLLWGFGDLLPIF